MTSNIVLSNKEFKVVGKRPIRHDGYDKVTGKAQYGADISPPGLLHGKILRSPHAHAGQVNVLAEDVTGRTGEVDLLEDAVGRCLGRGKTA